MTPTQLKVMLSELKSDLQKSWAAPSVPEVRQRNITDVLAPLPSLPRVTYETAFELWCLGLHGRDLKKLRPRDFTDKKERNRETDSRNGDRCAVLCWV